MDVKGHADFSSYILFEATGDSEADICDPIMGENAYEHGRVDEHDDDDALSCSYDESDACNIASELNMYDESCDDDDDDDEHDDAKKEDEEKDDAYGASYCEDDEMQENQKSCVSSDSSQEEFVDEMEKDKLFWEACLAS